MMQGLTFRPSGLHQTILTFSLRQSPTSSHALATSLVSLPDTPPPGYAWKVDGEGNYILDGEGNKIAIAT